MNKNIFHRYLKLPFEYKKPVRFNISHEHPNMVIVLRKEIDDIIIKWIETFNLCVSNVIEGFYTPKNGGKLPMHNDTSEITNACKINFTWGPSDSVTRWWQVKSPELLKSIKPDNNHLYAAGIKPDILITEAFTAREEDCNMVYEQVINKPSLMNIGQLHNTYNPNLIEDRWTLCFTLLKLDGSHLQFEDAINIFKNYIDE